VKGDDSLIILTDNQGKLVDMHLWAIHEELCFAKWKGRSMDEYYRITHPNGWGNRRIWNSYPIIFL